MYTQLGLYIDGKWNHGNGGGGEERDQSGDRRSRSPTCRMRPTSDLDAALAAAAEGLQGVEGEVGL